MKERFFKYLGPEKDLSGYQRSYKLVLYKYLFEMMDNQGYAPAYELAVAFKNYYVDRIKSGRIPDKDVEERIRNVENSSVRDIYNVIVQNPYDAINKQGYLTIEKRIEGQKSKEYFKLAPELVSELTVEDIAKINDIIEVKLTLYYSKIDGVDAADLQSLFNAVLNGYLVAKGETFGGHPLASMIRNNFPKEIFKTGFITPGEYVVTGSPGQGNWATVPWVGVFNKAITSSATKGVYIVYLFASDCESVYLTFNQGCTELKNTHGRTVAIEMMQEVAAETIASIDARGFSTGDHIDLKTKLELPFLYERGTIFYKEYKKGQVPSNDILASDLKKMIDIYDDWIKKGNKKADDQEQIGGEEEMPTSTKAIIEQVQQYIAAEGFNFEEGLIKNFYLSLKSKPFVILAGISGTGKTKLVHLFAKAIGAEYKLVPVRPDWSDSSDLFGHLDLNGRFIEGAITSFVKEASQNPDRPYILCLDEMNLARVEYYFSDFLSIIETRRFENGTIVSDPLVNTNLYGSSDARDQFGEMIFTENLYIVGTVNMDETTFPFSRKVLDRSNTIEFSYVDLIPNRLEMLAPVEPVSVDNSFLKTEYLQLSHCEDRVYVDEICTELQELNNILMKADTHVGYRVRDEIVFYMLNNKKNELIPEEDAFDNEIMQKILPRIQGSSSVIKNMLIELFQACAGDYTGLSGSNSYDQMTNFIANKPCKYRKSANKIAFMTRRFEEDGFTSYWL